MELLQLKYFCTAAETENFTKAAKIHNVPTSNISQIIRKLEIEFGLTLFDRSANTVALNEHGKLLYSHVKPALAMINDAKTKLCDSDDISGEIKILAETNRGIVTKAIESFQNKHSGASFFLNNSEPDSLDKYDLIITDKIFTKKHFEKKLLVTDELLLAFRKDNALANAESISVSDLENQRFITMGNKSGLFKLTHEICSSGGFVPNIVIQSDDPHYIRSNVESGLGICFYPSVSWKGMFSDNIESRRIVNIKRYTYIYRNTQKYLTKTTSLFLEVLLELAAEQAKK